MIPSETKTFSDLDLLTEIDSTVSFVGVKENEDNSFTDFRFRPELPNLPEATELTGDEYIVILQEGKRKKLKLSDLTYYISNNGSI